MRTLLRNSVTGLYLESPGAWTGRPEAAFAFPKMGEAIGFARQSELRGMELVFVSESAGPLLRVPLETIGYGCQPAAAGATSCHSPAGPV